MNKIISFPQLGNYGIPLKCFFEKISNCSVILPSPINNNTKKDGSKYSPDYVCSPFKFNLGNYIDALNNGANILIQAGGGCRYGYYAELQEKILRDMGYKFEFINLISKNRISLIKLYKFAKKHNKKLNNFSFFYNLINCSIKVILMDKLENYLRINLYKFKVKKKINRIYDSFLFEINNNRLIIKNIITYKKTIRKIKKQDIYINTKMYKVAIIGELFTLMEKEANCRIEEKLIEQNFSILRNTDFTYLLLKKKFKLPLMIKRCNKYIKYHLGADGTSSVDIAKKCAKKGYDGIIHLKSFGCTPEINAMPILNKISTDYNIPIIYFSFDVLDNEINVDNRLEAFCEMIKLKKSK